MVNPLPTFPTQTASAAYYGSLSKLFLFDARNVLLPFARWAPEALPASFSGVGGVKVYFRPETAAVSMLGGSSAFGSATSVDLTFETIDDSPAVLAWLTSLCELPLFALTYPVLAGLIRGFQTLYLTYEYKNTGEYAKAPRYLVSLKPKGLVKVWYTEMPAPTGESQPGPVLPDDPDEPENPDNPNPPKPGAFSKGFSKGFS